MVHRRDDIESLVVPDLFRDELYAATYDLVRRCPTLHEAIESGGPEVAELVQRLSVEESLADPVDVAARLWEPYLERMMADLRASMATADLDRLREIGPEQTWIKLHLEAIREPTQQAGAIADLLGWMGETPKDGQ